MPILTNFLLELGCDGYSLFDQVVADFGHGLACILHYSVKAPQLNASPCKPSTMAFYSLQGFTLDYYPF